MKKFEYWTFLRRFKPGSHEEENFLKDMGNQGWELTFIFTVMKDSAYIYYFKKEKHDVQL